MPVPSATSFPDAGPNSGIRVLVVGAGFAGLGKRAFEHDTSVDSADSKAACAIESRLNGHEVVLLDKFAKPALLGDIITFSSNSGRFFERWGLGDAYALPHL